MTQAPRTSRTARTSKQTKPPAATPQAKSPAKHAEFLLEHCLAVVEQALTFTHPADNVLSHYFREHRQLGQHVRAIIAETLYGLLRRKNFFEHYSLSAPKGSGSRAKRLTLLAFAAQGPTRAGLLENLEPDTAAWLQHCADLNPAELDPSCQHNLPDWLAQTLAEEIGTEAMYAYATASQEKAMLDVRVNSLMIKRDALLQQLRARGQQVKATSWSPWGLRFQQNLTLSQLPEWQAGQIEVQDEGSQLLAALVGAKRGEMVVDFCAGAGGKTLALGADMRSTGRLYAFDTAAHRLQALQPRLKRSGLSNVHPVVISHERDDRVQRLNGKIDRVLVDAPCSGLGTLRRNPDLKWRQTPQSVAELQTQQSAILAASARLLKVGGRLVYATCSVLRAENEDIVTQFQAAHPEFELIDVATLIAHKQLAEQGFLRLWPQTHGTDGFFAAVWQRTR